MRGALADLREGGDGGDQMRTEHANSCWFGGGRIGTKDGKNGERIKSRVYGCTAEQWHRFLPVELLVHDLTLISGKTATA